MVLRRRALLPGDVMSASAAWPSIRYDDWSATCQTLHLWTQIVGKIRLALSPPVNHSWHVTLYVTSRGLGTSPIPEGPLIFEIDFDFVDHRLEFTRSDGKTAGFPLEAMSVAEFYRRVQQILGTLEIDATIHRRPSEIADGILFHLDEKHASYDPDAVNAFWRALVQVDEVFKEFRGRFIGKASPVHFFWGSFDHAVSRFSGRRAPEHPGGIPALPDRVVREAYSHEVSSAGFWPGGNGFDAAFYSYAYPEPEGFSAAEVRPNAAFYSADLKEFVLPYDAVRGADDPRGTLMAFLQSTYEAAASLGKWDREALERN